MPDPASTRLFRARTVVTMNGPVIADGGLAVRDGEILAVARWGDLLGEHPAAIREDLGEVILLPGLINAHCHLDYTMMKGALFGNGSFPSWIQRLNAMRRSLDRSDYIDAIGEGLGELRRWGCTTVFNIESFPELVPFLPASPIRVWWFLEVMDVRSRLESAEALAGAIRFFEQADEPLSEEEGGGGFGISPHAPYTASADLYRLVRLCAEKHGLPVCTHMAESAEEIDMFTRGKGEFFEFLHSIGRPMDDCTGMTPLQMILGKGLLPEGAMLVHMNELSPEDRALLARNPKAHPVIHCPGTHAFFGRKPFDLEFFRGAGIPVLLGTDSLASNHGLDMFSEMRSMAACFPGLTPLEILAMATVLPAAAIGRRGRLGELSAGAAADFLAVDDPSGKGDPAERVLANTLPPRVWIAGRT